MNSRRRSPYIWEASWAHEVAHNRRLSDDGDSETISLFLIVCRIGNLNCQFGWLQGSRMSLSFIHASKRSLPARSPMADHAIIHSCWSPPASGSVLESTLA